MYSKRKEIAEQITRLMGIFTLKPTQVDSTISEWCRTFSWVPNIELEKAVTRHIDTAKYFPKPREIKEILANQGSESQQPARRLSAYERWKRNPVADDGQTGEFVASMIPCPVCLAEWRWDPRLTIKHDEQAHDEAGEPIMFGTYADA